MSFGTMFNYRTLWFGRDRSGTWIQWVSPEVPIYLDDETSELCSGIMQISRARQLPIRSIEVSLCHISRLMSQAFFLDFFGENKNQRHGQGNIQPRVL
ncbi:hypothetical protein BofuT4_uP143980.1 [Botrytis cinerea T4]|uniref:Uncharacterized protein n=1 Tax=Botryotinia fuckeliana (strain T4) TaxID=999810 RepID=G2YY92_BOTF4|nr:hypothetical protein BofuT4_uP143980.1 [Botrytis cinerea T4]